MSSDNTANTPPCVDKTLTPPQENKHEEADTKHVAGGGDEANKSHTNGASTCVGDRSNEYKKNPPDKEDDRLGSESTDNVDGNGASKEVAEESDLTETHINWSSAEHLEDVDAEAEQKGEIGSETNTENNPINPGADSNVGNDSPRCGTEGVLESISMNDKRHSDKTDESTVSEDVNSQEHETPSTSITDKEQMHEFTNHTNNENKHVEKIINEESESTIEKIQTDNIKDTSDLIKDLNEDETTKKQQVVELKHNSLDLDDSHSSPGVDSPTSTPVCASENVTETTDNLEMSQLEGADEKTKESRGNGRNNNDLASEILKEKDTSSRNVFDALSINMPSQSKDTNQTSENECCDEDNVNESEMDEKMKTSNKGIKSSDVSNSDKGISNTSKKKHPSVNTSESEPEKLDTKCSSNEKVDFNEDSSKGAVKTSNKNKKEQKHVSLGPQERDVLQESDILKKAKEKYNLKELRISLNTDEVKDCSEVSSVVGQSDKGFSVKVPKVKSITEDSLSEKHKKETSEKDLHEEKPTKTNNDKDDKSASTQSNQSTDHLVDSDSVKPLKKRVRRGYEETHDTDIESGKPETEILDNPPTESDVVSPTSGVNICEKEMEISVEMKEGAEVTIPTVKTVERKGKKAKKKSKKSSKSSNKKSMPILTPEKEIDIIEEKSESVQIENNSESPDKEMSETLTVSEEPTDIPKTVQLKKYPGRSCKLRNQLPQIPLKPKKPKTPAKSKVSDPESETKSSELNTSSVKIKKKRKRKVKPWSWGNEKKKYKPKVKILVEDSDVLLQNKDLVTNISDDKPEINVEQESTQNNDTVIPSESKNDSNVDTSTVDTSSVQDEVENCEPNVVSELTEQVDDKLENSGSSISELVTKPLKEPAGKSKKKGKKGRKKKSELLHNANTLDKNGNEQSQETAVPGPLNADIVETDNMEVRESEQQRSELKVLNGVSVTEPISSENINEDSMVQSQSNLLLHQEEISDVTCKDTDTVDETTVEGPKRKRGKVGRPKKGEGKGRNKKRKLDTETSSTSTQADTDKCLDSAPVEGIHHQDHVEVNVAAANVAEHVDNELPVDNYPHVSPDSGIQSLAGSPAGNESPNSVIINVDNSSNNHSSSGGDSKSNNESGVKTKESSGSHDGVTSTSSVLDLESKTSAAVAESNNETAVQEKLIDTVPESDCQKSSTKVGKAVTGDGSPNTGDGSPSKKKNRAKFLQLHKTSTLLQKGRLPTEEEKVKRLDDKFDYPEKVSDKLASGSPTIDLYSQHMNSFQVTHGNCETIGNPASQLEKDLHVDFGKEVHSLPKKMQKVSKKSHSKHKGKRKNASHKSRTSIFEKMSDLQGQVETLLNSRIAQPPVVSTSSSVISDYSPAYHSSSVLTPVTSTVTSVALIDSLTTCSSVTRPIASVIQTTSHSAEPKMSTLSEAGLDCEHITDSIMPTLELASNFSESVETSQTDLSEVTTSIQTDISQLDTPPVKKKRGRPPSKKKDKKKSVIALKNRIVIKGRKGIKTPPSKNLSTVVEKRNRGRPKGSKNKATLLKETVKSLSHSLSLEPQQNVVKTVELSKNEEPDQTMVIVNQSKEKNKTSHLSPVKDNSTSSVPTQDKVKRKKQDEESTVKSQKSPESSKNPSFSKTMMEWRESSVLGHDKEEKKKRGPGRPRKHPIGAKKTSTKSGESQKSNSTESFTAGSKSKDIEELELPSVTSVPEYLETGPVDDIQLPPVFKDDDLVLLDDSVKQMPKIRKSKLHPMLKKGKRGRKKGFRCKKPSEQSVEVVEEEVGETEDLVNMPDLQPARSVSSHDSDTSGAGSSFGSKAFQVQMWMEMTRHKGRRKNKQKLRYFRSKHKNIIDPVFISRVDCLIGDFTDLSISPPNETFLKVRPWEVPLPSIFKIVRINIKKKKKDRLFVFEKAKPLKPKNELESGPKDKIKLGRKIGDHLLDLSDITDQQHYNLPPKKRHKLFSGLGPDDAFPSQEGVTTKPEKRKAGRPRKVRPPSPEQSTSFSFGEVHKTKQGFEMGKDTTETLASFASVAAQSCPNSSFSPEKNPPPSFTSASPRGRDHRTDKHMSGKSSNKPESGVHTKPVPSSSSVNTKSVPPPSSSVNTKTVPVPSGSQVTEPSETGTRTDARSTTCDRSRGHTDTVSGSKPRLTIDKSRGHTDVVPGSKPRLTVDKSRSHTDAVPGSKPRLTCDKSPEESPSGMDDQSNDDETKVNSPKVVNNKHLNRKVKKLKRKYRKSKKLTKVKRKPVRPVEAVLEMEDSVDIDSSVRSVCSESEPLPTFHLDKRKHDSESEDDVAVRKRPKIFKQKISDASQESDSATVRKQAGPVNQKKKYQKAGLYSDSYKDNEKTDQKEATNTYFTFDLPLHFGQHQLKNQINDYQLPYDVWWLHFNDMLPKKGDGKQYKRIRNNIYVDARPACRYEAHSCNCKKPLNPNEKGCGEDCINRLVYTECSAGLCPCYDQCNNQNIQKHQFASGLQKYLTKDRGFGVRTAKPIKTGQLIVEYCGEVVSVQEFQRRMTEEYSQDRNHYCLNLDSGTVIDGYRKGNIARFVNHSCEPNCEMQKWNVDGVYRMCLFALRDIEPGEEMVYDYNFQSFNHDAQQLCKCGSKDCRGIIGGKKQWFNGQGKNGEKSGKKGKNAKDKRKSKLKQDKMKDKYRKSVIPGYHQGLLPGPGGAPLPPFFTYPIKPLGKKDRIYARKHSIFLVRNFDRIRDMRDRVEQDSFKVTKENEDYIKGTHFTKRDVFIAQLTALKTSRSMKTRRLTVAEEDTEVGKMARIAGVCKEIYSAITAAKDDEGMFLATDLYHLPSKKKHPRYYQVIDEPIDLTMMEKKILSGRYQTVEAFEKDMIKLFQNVELYCGKKSEMGDKIRVLRAILTTAKREAMSQIQEIMGAESAMDCPASVLSDVDMQVATPTTSISSESDLSEISDNKGEWLQGEEEEEEIIRCICGIYKDEGLMIQCDKCYIWQHTDCMRVKGDIGHYLCEQCDPRPVNREVELVPSSDDESEPSDDGNRYFMTLMRDDMQIRLGACVYVMKENQSRRYSYKKSGGLDKDRMDIFRIERLWKNRKGDKFAFGHMYIRPHETFHEPNRRFFPNEVFRTPLYEMFHLESITGYSCVLDLLTYCKGKPKGYKDEDLYICEYRMDKTLHHFYKISAKQRCPINTRSYCFEMNEKRLNPKRTYSPHEVPESYKRNWREKSSSSDDNPQEKKPVSDEEEDVPLVKVKIERRKEKRERVNRILDVLSKGKLSPSKKRTDLTYLLID